MYVPPRYIFFIEQFFPQCVESGQPAWAPIYVTASHPFHCFKWVEEFRAEHPEVPYRHYRVMRAEVMTNPVMVEHLEHIEAQGWSSTSWFTPCKEEIASLAKDMKRKMDT